MKLSNAIANLQGLLERSGDIEVTYIMFTIFDIKSDEHFDNSSDPYFPYDDDELATEIIQECEKNMWEYVVDTIWGHIDTNASIVVERKKKESQDYQEYLRLKAKFEPN